MFNSIGDVLQLMVVGDWKTFESAVLSNPALFRHIAGAVSSCSQLNGMTMLHAAVRYNPPLNIVAQIIRICPDMPATEDCLHRTPLHVAAGSRASASLIELLACACPSACDVQDVEGKTPLHFACDSSCVLFEEDHDTEVDSDGEENDVIDPANSPYTKDKTQDDIANFAIDKGLLALPLAYLRDDEIANEDSCYYYDCSESDVFNNRL